MKGMLTPRQLKKLERENYSLYEYLVARHMWVVIKRKLHLQNVVQIKQEVAQRYDVDWIYNCWLCENHDVSCLNCPLCANDYEPGESKSGCSTKYAEFAYACSRVLPVDVRRDACDNIIEVIDREAKEYGIIQ